MEKELISGVLDCYELSILSAPTALSHLYQHGSIRGTGCLTFILLAQNKSNKTKRHQHQNHRLCYLHLAVFISRWSR